MNKKYKYSISFESNANLDTSFIGDESTGLALDVKNLVYKKEKLKDARIIYPEGGAKNIAYLNITFNKKVSKDTVENLVNYWGAIKYVGKLGGLDWADNELIVHLDIKKSTSRNINKRNILELLMELLEGGTPKKKNGTKTFQGLGNVVEKIEGCYW